MLFDEIRVRHISRTQNLAGIALAKIRETERATEAPPQGRIPGGI
jgi:hypothetical protein